MNINAVKLNTMTVKAPVGPGQQIPFRGANLTQDTETPKTPLTGDVVNFQSGKEISNGANLPKVKGFRKVFQNFTKKFNDFVKLDNPELAYHIPAYSNYSQLG